MSAKPIRWMMTGAGKPFVPMEFEIGTLAPDEVLVEIAGCGVCHTDLGYYYDGVRTKHELPLALGHEISGHVIDTGTDALWFTDRAVIIPAVIPCGHCDACKRGKATICPNQKMPGNDIQGGFATHIVVPSHGLCVVDERRLAGVGIDLADLSVIADAVTTPYQAVVQAGVKQGRSGHRQRRRRRRRLLRADRGRHGRRRRRDRCQPGQTCRHHRAGRRAHAQFQADVATRPQSRHPGLCQGTRAASDRVDHFRMFRHPRRPGDGLQPAQSWRNARVVGFTMDKVEVRLSNLMAYHARAIGNWGCPPELYPAALELVMNGRVKVTPFVEKHPLSEINQVFEAVHAGAIKRRAVLVPAP